jgi:hypothetical protein
MVLSSIYPCVCMLLLCAPGAGGDDDDGEFVINRKATNSKKMDISP